MILENKAGIKLTLDRYLDGTQVFKVSGPGIDTLRWYGYQNERYAYEYFNKSVTKSMIKIKKRENVKKALKTTGLALELIFDFGVLAILYLSLIGVDVVLF